ncbi:DapH/DapD/GlmU-related protein [Pseudomonas sp. NFR16]|uniref:acyltransferase n=1 Tax=Pseudomonas sp. NFR16 TaxID=1566248 RepID=UPI0008CEAAA3|nr:acyltransferase [Pseudomonas sp. NFR16]SEI83524.1 galactoside O-acetyltransferase [Pseudomonas sp. NFR16]
MGRSNEVNEGFRTLGDNVKIYPGAKVYGREFISIGSNVIIDDFVFIYATAPLYIGSYVHISSFCSISGGGTVVFEDFSGLASGVRVVCGSDDFLGGGLTNPTVPAEYRNTRRSFVHIGRHAIVGANAVILPGVTIGEGTAVGSGSVISKSLEPWSVYAGLPARRIKARPHEVILESERALASDGLFQPMAASVFRDALNASRS